MLTSKKLIYFILFSLVLMCGIVGVDYRSSYYADLDQELEVVDFYNSGFYAVGSRDDALVSIVSTDDDGGAAAVQYVDQTNTTSQTADVQEEQVTTTSTDPEQIILTPIPETTASTVSPVQNTRGTSGDDTTQTTTRVTTTTTTATRTTTTTRMTTTSARTTTTTRATTTRVTTTTTAPSYNDSGDTHFGSAAVNLYVGNKAQVGVDYSIGAQRAVTFSSLNNAVATVRKVNNSTVEITGISKGTTYICGTHAGGVFYCKVTVSDYATEVIRLVNVERAKYGLAPLQEGPSALQNLANVRLNEIMSVFAHTRPDGRSFDTVARDYNFSYRYLGENLAWGQTTPQQVVDAWMNSTAHRRNILSQDPASGAPVAYQYLCVGYGLKDGVPYWTQIFYSP